MTNFDRISARSIRDYLRYKKSGEGAFSLAATFAIYKQLRKSRPEIHKNAPAGDGHPVLVIPAFLAHDVITRPLRQILREKGYRAYGWKGKLNLGVTEKKADHLVERLKEIYEENNHRKVTIIGHSLGGLYARTLAQEYPEMVRDVITDNTPFGAGVYKDAIPPLMLTLIEALSNEKYSVNNPGIAERLLTPPPVPTTSIFSKIDPVAGWKACLNPDTPQSENIEVESSHISSIFDPKTMEIILDRLAQPEGQWKKHKDRSAEATPPNPNWKPKPNSTSWQFFKHP